MSAVLVAGADARAEVKKNLGTALDFAGFDLQGQRNPLSGGIDFLATNTFDGAPFDFGAWDLSLSGPLSLQVSTGGRFLSQFNVSLTTAVNGRTDATPLSYTLNSDIGAQSTQISGTMLADVDFSLNGLGFYDLSITYSSRQNVTKDGLLANDGTTNDFDLGPINISGNLFADALMILTDPFFGSAGRPNPFEPFSGRAQLSDILQASATDLQAALADGGDPGGAASTAKRFAVVQKGFGNGDTPPGNGYGQGNGNGGGYGNSNGAAVPEPAVLMLMLLGIPAIVWRRSARVVALPHDLGTTADGFEEPHRRGAARPAPGGHVGS